MPEIIYPSKEMCNSQLKKLMCLKYLILKTPFNFFSIFSWYFIVLRLPITHVFSYLQQELFLFWLFQPFLFCISFYNFKKENILNIFSIDLILFQIKAL